MIKENGYRYFSDNMNDYDEKVVEYSSNGMIKRFQRRGKKSNGIYGKIDNLHISLDGNRPISIVEDAGNQTVYGAMEFQSHGTSGTQYGYDDNGSLIWDANKKIAHITYDNLNYPKEVQFTNGNRIQYIYSPDGQKLRATWQTAVANIVVPLNSTVNLSSSQISSTTRTDYIGNVIYTGTASGSSASVKLSKYLFEGGYATVTPTTQPVFHYFTQDHLGNNRAVVSQIGTVEQITHYYPFGGFFADQGTNSSLQPYKYNGKELDRMHGLDLYDYGARQYDPIVPMFTQQDPMAEKYHHLSPYAYCGNNPVNAIDVKGDSTAVVNMGYGTNQHIALLIQNENNEWQYYSFNGTPIYNLTNGKFGGGPHDNFGEKAFKSPQEFLDSDYNTYEGHPKERMGRDEINGYGYNEAYVLPTSAEQDKTIKETFESKINEGYSLIRNHCGHAVQEALNSVGIKTSVRIYNNETLSYEESVPFLPSNTFIFIKTNRSGITLYRNK